MGLFSRDKEAQARLAAQTEAAFQELGRLALDGVVPIGDVQWRARVKVAGRVKALRVQPWSEKIQSLELTLVDGTAVGTVREVESNPASDLLVLDSGALVPVVFVVDQGPGRLTIDPPEGLLEL